MNSILISIAIVTGIGLLAGILLSVASEIMSVPVNEKTVKIRECLPGANCGCCGFSGCDGYADALSNGVTENTALCAPGGEQASQEIAAVLGISAGKSDKKVAAVICMGTRENTDKILNYKGVKSCLAATQLYSGGGKCPFACIGYGDCEKVCPNEAIHICNGLAVINPELCSGCGQCVNTCPKSVISLVKYSEIESVRCRNTKKGAVTRKECSVGCIGCCICAKKCPNDAIILENNLAKIDPEKCTGCGICEKSCPRGCITAIK